MNFQVKSPTFQLCLTLYNSMDYQPARLLCPWDFSGKNTVVGSQYLHQGIFPTQGSNLGLLHHRQILYYLSNQRVCPKISCISNVNFLKVMQVTVWATQNMAEGLQFSSFDLHDVINFIFSTPASINTRHGCQYLSLK